MSQIELKFQDHIVKSYKAQGGMAKKWSSEWEKGPPDLICALPTFGGHLMEVKQLDSFVRPRKNQLTEKQQSIAQKYLDGGCLVVAGLVLHTKGAARGSNLGIFNPVCEMWDPNEVHWFPYVIGQGFDVNAALRWYIYGEIA